MVFKVVEIIQGDYIDGSWTSFLTNWFPFDCINENSDLTFTYRVRPETQEGDLHFRLMRTLQRSGGSKRTRVEMMDTESLLLFWYKQIKRTKFSVFFDDIQVLFFNTSFPSHTLFYVYKSYM